MLRCGGFFPIKALPCVALSFFTNKLISVSGVRNRETKTEIGVREASREDSEWCMEEDRWEQGGRWNDRSECVCVCSLNRVSHHPRSASPSCPLPLRSLGTWRGVCFTASWSGSEWMMGWQRQPECGVWCVTVQVFQCSLKYSHLHYLLVQGPLKAMVHKLLFCYIYTLSQLCFKLSGSQTFLSF